jgi:hypothetical protein
MRPEHLGAGNSVTMGLLPPSMWPSTLPRARAAATDGSPAGTAAGFYEALAAGDTVRAADLLGPDVAFFEAPGRPFAPAGDASQGGGDAVRRILAPLGTGAAGLEVVTHELLEYGSAILALGTWRRRPAGGEPGRSVAYAHVWVFEGVTLRELRQYAAWLPRAEPRREGRAAAGGGL